MPDATLRSLIADYLSDLPDGERQSLIAEVSAIRKENTMSLDAIESEITGLRAQATQIAEDYARTQAEVAADTNLTEAGKTETLAPLHEQMRTQISDLRQQEKAILQRKRESLEKELYGTSSGDIAGYRNAQVEAARIATEQEADTLYVNAVRSNDTVFAKAIFAQSSDRGWARISEDYLRRNPSAKSALSDLERIRRYENNGLASALHYMPVGLSTDKPVMPVAISTGEMRSFFSGGRR